MSTTPPVQSALSTAELTDRTRQFLSEHPPPPLDAGREARLAFLGQRFDAGLAAVHYPVGLGGLGLPREKQRIVDEILAESKAPSNRPASIIVNLGMAGPTILAAGNAAQKQLIRPLWTGEDVWCQLFSEPGAGSDLAGLATKAVRDGDDWVITGQKVWTSLAHKADRAILLARTDPAVPKHQGITYFLLDMTAPGVTVRPLRQITGEAEFNEVFLDKVRIPDSARLGGVGEGWKLAVYTLSNERSGGTRSVGRESGPIAPLLRAWRGKGAPGARPAELRDDVTRAWIRAEAVRLTGEQIQQQLAAGAPGPEASAAKLATAETNKAISSLGMIVMGADALIHSDGYAFSQPDHMSVDTTDSTGTYAYLRSRANSIEGGTSEVLRGVIAQRILGLPVEPRADKTLPWNEVPR